MQNKRNRWSQIILIGFLTVLFILSNLSLVLANNQGKITAIVVQGNENISKDLIISQIASNLGDVFSKENIEKDFDMTEAVKKLKIKADKVEIVSSISGHFDVMDAWLLLTTNGMKHIVCMIAEIVNDSGLRLTGREIQLCE